MSGAPHLVPIYGPVTAIAGAGPFDELAREATLRLILAPTLLEPLMLAILASKVWPLTIARVNFWLYFRGMKPNHPLPVLDSNRQLIRRIAKGSNALEGSISNLTGSSTFDALTTNW